MPRPPMAIGLLVALTVAAHAQRPQAPADRPAPAPATTAAPSQPASAAASPRNANYSIDVTLDPGARLLHGSEVITWRNTTSRATSELQFHLYYNAWMNTRSSWMRERIFAGDPTGVARRPERDWSWVDVRAVRLLGAAPGGPFVDLSQSGRFIQPDDGNADDRTVLAVPLPAPVGPGESVTLQVDWRSRVPRTFARTGTVGDFFFLAHWFPKLGVLEERGWNTHQFHARTEFFADFGVYDVRLTVPAGWTVGATGRERGRTDNGNGTTTHRYVQEDVHDFAWTTSPDLLERTARFEHPRLPAVDLRLLLQPEHAGQADRHFEAARAALRFYGEWFGPYPYGHLTIVDPAWQSGAGGMEYPTLITAGTRWLAPRLVADPEGVTVHEAGHQFWYGLVASNEFEHAWMDEGLTTFSTARTMEAAGFPDFHSERFFGGFVPWVFTDLPFSRATDGNRLPGYRRAPKSDVSSTPSWRLHPATGGVLIYNKTALWLHTLERLIGWPRLQKGMATYFARATFRHPAPDEFFRAIGEAAGRDLTWFFDQTHRSSVAFDYGVDALTSRREALRGHEPSEAGFVFRDGTPAADAPYRTTVVVRRHEEGVFPVDVLVEFEDGSRETVAWDGRDRWKAFTFDRPSRAARAFVDPERVLLLDVNYTNNSRALAPDAAPAARRWAARWLVWLQDLMLTYASLV